MKAAMERRPPEPGPASDDRLALWAVEVWAMPEDELRRRAAVFAEVQADPERTPAERQAAARLIDALDYALSGQVPPVRVMRAAGIAVSEVAKGIA